MPALWRMTCGAILSEQPFAALPTAACSRAGESGVGVGLAAEPLDCRIHQLRRRFAILVFAHAFHSEHVWEIKTALNDGQKLRAEGRLPEALRSSAVVWSEPEPCRAIADLKHSLKRQITLAQRGQKAAALHELADLIRFRHGIQSPRPPRGTGPDQEHPGRLERTRRAPWRSGAERLDLASEQLIRADLLELAIAFGRAAAGAGRPPAELERPAAMSRKR